MLFRHSFCLSKNRYVTFLTPKIKCAPHKHRQNRPTLPSLVTAAKTVDEKGALCCVCVCALLHVLSRALRVYACFHLRVCSMPCARRRLGGALSPNLKLRQRDSGLDDSAEKGLRQNKATNRKRRKGIGGLRNYNSDQMARNRRLDQRRLLEEVPVTQCMTQCMTQRDSEDCSTIRYLRRRCPGRRT